jgi:ABC-type multidrug transport system fused ATPase/permease subunit
MIIHASDDEPSPSVARNRTAIIVAHRLSTIQKSDRIIVLHKGRIREMGTHQELLALRGIYYRLYELQYADEAERRAAVMGM